MSDDTPRDDTPTGPFDPDDDATQRFDRPANDDKWDGEPDAATRRLDQVPPNAPPSDSPTERFPDASPPMDGYSPTRAYSSPQPIPRDAAIPNDAPTELFVSQQPYQPISATQPGSPHEPEKKRASRAPLITLITLGTLVVAGLVVFLLVLASRGNEATPVASASPSESASATPSETPSPTPTPTPSPTETAPPEPITATFTSFSPEDRSTVDCPDEDSSVPLEFSWSSEDAVFAWIGVGTTDAKSEPFAKVDTSGSEFDISFQCGNQSEVYTVTLESPDGELTSQSVTLLRQLP